MDWRSQKCEAPHTYGNPNDANICVECKAPLSNPKWTESRCIPCWERTQRRHQHGCTCNFKHKPGCVGHVGLRLIQGKMRWRWASVFHLPSFVLASLSFFCVSCCFYLLTRCSWVGFVVWLCKSFRVVYSSDEPIGTLGLTTHPIILRDDNILALSRAGAVQHCLISLDLDHIDVLRDDAMLGTRDYTIDWASETN